jgi:pyruvate dehydrogenase E2 component (dihydrolipoamide acetyltransferase)
LTESNEYVVVPIVGIRKTIAERLQASYQKAPHIALTLSVDMSETQRLIAAVSDMVRSQSGHALTLTSVIAKLVASVLLRHPRLNTHLIGGEIRQFRSVHMGIAVALQEGLIVPVVRDIQQKGLAAIQAEISDLSARARAGTLKPSEVRGSTFTISNLGMFGIEQFTAILNHPEVGILSVGTITDVPTGVEGEITLRPMMQLTLNADHRVVDGAVAAHFLQDLKRTIASPYQLFV